MVSMAPMLLLWYVIWTSFLTNHDSGGLFNVGEGVEDALGNMLTKPANSTQLQ
jgi:hypothetical protein